MNPDERRARANQLLQTIDWSNYDYSQAEGADMNFPDYAEGPHGRAVWISKHYNQTANMQTCHVIDLNDLTRGFERRLYALYGVPVDWTGGEESEYLERISTIDRARAASPELHQQWLSYYGMVNEEHLEWMRERVTGKPGAITNAMAQALLDQKMEEQKQAHAGRADAMRETGELAPFMGIALESWAQAQAAITSGAQLAQVLPRLGIDEATWQSVSAEWNARMSRDTTTTIATVYGQAFVGAGQGQFGAAGQATAAAMNPGGRVDANQAPITFEKWIEISVAGEAGSQNGLDPAAVLAQFGMSPADWGMAGGWWGQHFAANAMAMKDDYDRWTAHFQQQYGVGHADGMTNDEREEATIEKLLEMARTGQAGNIVPFLQDKFPDDANDMDALDWWVDKACDTCAQLGDRGAAQQLLAVRYTMQDDRDEPMHEWVESEMESLF